MSYVYFTNFWEGETQASSESPDGHATRHMACPECQAAGASKLLILNLNPFCGKPAHSDFLGNENGGRSYD